jgi:hypothetical protein
MNESPIDRRSMLTAAAAACALPTLAAGAGDRQVAESQRRASVDPLAPAQRLATAIRMRGALDTGLVITFLEGVYYGVMAARIRPLYGICAALFRQYRPRADGGFDYANYELVFITDLDTGGLLPEFRNPYSGKVVKPPQARFGPSRFAVYPSLEVQRTSPLVSAPAGRGANAAHDDGSHFHRFRSPRVVGDDVWLVEESTQQLPSPADVPLNEMLTYHASLRDLSDPSLTHVPTDLQFNPVIGWRPWQGMENFDGPPSHVLGVCAGRVVRRFEELPAAYRRWTAQFHPDVQADPLKLLAPAWAPQPAT